MSRGPGAAGPGLALAAVALALYGRGLGRGFVSEDFLILRQLHERGFWELLGQHLSGPWLGVSIVSFYRPVSTLLLQAEHLAFGVRPWSYLLVHLSVHGLCSFLVFGLARRLGAQRGPAWAVAALFTLYPLHPNTVIFVASFATLFGAAFALAAVRLHLDGRRLAGPACFALALGSYEQAAALPVLLLAVDLLDPRRSPDNQGLARRHAPFWALLVAYLAIRGLALGRTVGGYGTFHDRLSPERWADLAREALVGLGRLVDPGFAPPLAEAWAAAVAVGALAAAVWAAIRVWSGRPGGTARFGVLAAVWVLACQAPFFFAGVVPGNGRYAYLASVGLAFALMATARAVAALLPGRAPRRALALALLALATVRYGWLLHHNVGVYADAGRLADELQHQLRQLPERDGPTFVVGHPDFLNVGPGVPAAQVFHWGLADAARPPFAPEGLRIYALPRLEETSLEPLVGRFGPGSVVRWTGDALVPVSAAPPPARLAVDSSSRPPELRFEPRAGRRHRLVAVAPGGFDLRDLPAAGPGTIEVRIHPGLRQSMERLYGEPFYAWIEVWAGDGRLLAASEVYEIGSAG